MKVKVILTVCLFSQMLIYGQIELPEVEALNRVSFSRNDTLFEFYAVKPSTKIITKPEQTYYWFRRDTIHATVHGYDGRILDGPYKSLYPHKALLEQGEFENGQKTGIWKRWYPNGQLQNLTKWRDGRKNGDFQIYDQQGKLLQKGRYKEGKLEGPFIEYLQDGKIKTTQYKRGEPVIENSEEKKPQTPPSNG